MDHTSRNSFAHIRTCEASTSPINTNNYYHISQNGSSFSRQPVLKSTKEKDEINYRKIIKDDGKELKMDEKRNI